MSSGRKVARPEDHIAAVFDDAGLGSGFVLRHDVLQRAAQCRFNGDFPPRLDAQDGRHRPDDAPQTAGRRGPHDRLDRVLVAVHVLFQLFQHAEALTGGVQFTAKLLLGGIGLREEDGKQARELLTEAWSFTPERGWTRLPEMPYAIAAAPTPAPVSRNGVIYLLGGDDGSGKKYTPQTNPGFNNQSLCLDTAAMEWHDAGPIAAPRAVLPCCAWQGRFAAVNGELKPGRRSPEVWSITLS